MSMEVFATGDKAHGDDDLAAHLPVKIGGVGRTAAPASVAGNKRVNASFDVFGRQLSNLYFMRNLTASATATPTRAQEATIMAGNANNFLDLLTITAVNTSTSAIQMNIRSGTGGAVYDSIYLAATSSATRNYNPPLPQSEIGQAWTAQNVSNTDASDSAVTLTLLAILNPGV